MSNANTPAMMAQSMAESLFRENARLKKIEESYYRLLELDSGDVMIDTLNENDRLKEQNAMLTVQVQEALTRMDRARYLLTDGNPTPNCNWGMLDTSDIKAAHPQQVKSEDARDAEKHLAMLRDLMQRFDFEEWNCPRCGHSEQTATMDSASYLRGYLAQHDAALSAQEKTK